MKKISIVTACYNEETNVVELIERVRKIMAAELATYNYEHIFIDNSSEDRTVELLRNAAKEDSKIKVIVNSRNFGHIRSPSYALLNADGDAVISLVADFQDPPELIPDFIRKWEDGFDIVLAIKEQTSEGMLMAKVRELYYFILNKLAEIDVYKNFTGFGLFDKKVIAAIKQINDPYPFFRGLLAEVGFKVYKMPYNQPKRKRGFTKNNIYSLYDMGVLGIISNSKIPLRMAVFAGVISGLLSFLVGIYYIAMKLFFWDEMVLGVAPIVVMMSFMFSVLLAFVGIIGEYIGAIYTQVLNRPLVFVKEKINFDE